MTSSLVVLILAGDLIVGWLLGKAVAGRAVRKPVRPSVVIPFPEARPSVVIPFPEARSRRRAQPHARAEGWTDVAPSPRRLWRDI